VVEAELTIDTGMVNFTGKSVEALTVNGGIPGPTLEFTEGDIARIYVHNELDVPSSVHWHGLLVPAQEDGVPYVTFPGIPPRSVYTYEFPIRQAGTYWYHSHSGLQEQRGVYGSIVIHPKSEESNPVDRDEVVVLSDWTDEKPDRVMGLLKSENEWYSIRRDSNQSVWGALVRNRIPDFFAREWESMPPNEISDVAYDRFLINGQTDARISAKPGERVKLRLINAGAATYFYVQFAGGPMTVVAADGMDVEPFTLDRMLIAVAETYDVIVTVPGEGAFEFRATSQDGDKHVAALIGEGERVPAEDVPRPNYYQNAMNAGYFPAMWRTAWRVGGRVEVIPAPEIDAGEQGRGEAVAPAMKMSDAKMSRMNRADEKVPNKKMGGMQMKEVPEPPGRPGPPYAELRSPHDTTIPGPRATRLIKLNLTGDMDRYVWGINGQTISPSNTIRIRKGERVVMEFSNRTMMHHPMHLHGHFFRVLKGQGKYAPLKHTVDIAPMETTVIEFDANEEKDWFFHCHVLYHMKAGMERIVHYEGTEVDAATLAVRPRLYKDVWYAFGNANVLSNMSEGEITISNTRNIVGLGWEVGYDTGDYDVTAAYNYYVNRYLSPFAGINAYAEGKEGKDARGVLGLAWLLPLNIRTTVWVGTDASFRWNIGKDLPLTRRLSVVADARYDTKTAWEWSVGGEYVLWRSLSLYGQYSSDYGAGGGLRLRVYSSGF
jgi:CopA family copper-resistance protein